MPSWPMDQNSRLMLIAPHPDDETIPAGILLQQAIEAGASIQIVYLTSGDNNPWPQRYIEHHWKISTDDQARWGVYRRKEALTALLHLGVQADDTVFLGYPDQGLTEMLMNGDDEIVRTLKKMIIQRRPTILVTPSLYDLHADHSATAVFIRQMTLRL
jgi:LmbE family N-acetylglucosaminyl deacetylase